MLRQTSVQKGRDSKRILLLGQGFVEILLTSGFNFLILKQILPKGICGSGGWFAARWALTVHRLAPGRDSEPLRSRAWGWAEAAGTRWPGCWWFCYRQGHMHVLKPETFQHLK